jgi:hypothetical protein
VIVVGMNSEWVVVVVGLKEWTPLNRENGTQKRGRDRTTIRRLKRKKPDDERAKQQREK